MSADRFAKYYANAKEIAPGCAKIAAALWGVSWMCAMLRRER